MTNAYREDDWLMIHYYLHGQNYSMSVGGTNISALILDVSAFEILPLQNH